MCTTHFKSIVLGSGVDWETGIDTHTIDVMCMGFAGGSDGKGSACNAGDRG